MTKLVSLATLTIFLCGLMFTAVLADGAKTPKTPKTPEQIEKYRRNHPTTAPVTPTVTRTDQPRHDSGAAQPRHDGNRPPSTVDSGRRNDQTVVQPYRRDDDRDRDRDRDGRYDYVGRPHDSGRAYEVPQRHDNGRGNDNRYGYSYGHNYPPSRPLYIPAPAPRCGGSGGYYPSVGFSGPYLAPDCGDINRMPLLGSEIIAADGTFLGVIDRDYHGRESVSNRDGVFGNPYSRLSIFNPDGPYGSVYGPFSPWNRYSTRPPVLYWHGVFRGYLSTNPDMQPKVSPDSLPRHLGLTPWR